MSSAAIDVGAGLRGIVDYDEHGLSVAFMPARVNATLSAGELEAVQLLADVPALETSEMRATRLERIAALVPLVNRHGEAVDAVALVAAIREEAVLS